MDALVTIYSQWPPQHQMAFAGIALVFGSAIVFMLSWWGVMLIRDVLYYATIWMRGWPGEKSVDRAAPLIEGKLPNWLRLMWPASKISSFPGEPEREAVDQQKVAQHDRQRQMQMQAQAHRRKIASNSEEPPLPS